MNKYDVVALGELLIDFTCVSQDENGYPTVAAHPGGAPANFLAAVNNFGGKTAMIGKVGEDTFGHLLISTLEQSGIDATGIVLSKDVFTTLAFVTLDDHGDREFAFSRKPGADTQLKVEEINFDLIDAAKAFHFGTLSLTNEPAKTATYKAVEYAKKAGKLITFDPNLRMPLWDTEDAAKRQALWGLNAADIVKISNDEVHFLFAIDPEQGAQYILQNFGVKLVFVTCGENGCFFANKRTCGHVPGIKGLKVIDTCGAGDIFGGSAVWKALESGKKPDSLGFEELRSIVSFACATASLSTERNGGISSIPKPEEIERYLLYP